MDKKKIVSVKQGMKAVLHITSIVWGEQDGGDGRGGEAVEYLLHFILSTFQFTNTRYYSTSSKSQK
jgi:hypothetical protein